MPKQTDRDGREVAAIIGVLGSVLGMLEGGATHLGVATDHVIESFRNDLWAGYKTSEGIEPELLAQFHPLEDALRAMGVVVWAMEEFEADDALAAAARLAAASPDVEQVIVCTPDKDLSQCVSGERVVQFDRRKRELRDERGVVARFGVGPASIPDYLASYPRGSLPLPGAAEILFWSEDALPRLRPILSVTHLVVYTPAELPGITLMAAKQIYADHYFETAFDLTCTVDRSPGTYILVLRRYRFDNLPGGILNIRGRAIGALRDQLATDLRRKQEQH